MVVEKLKRKTSWPRARTTQSFRFEEHPCNHRIKSQSSGSKPLDDVMANVSLGTLDRRDEKKLASVDYRDLRGWPVSFSLILFMYIQ